LVTPISGECSAGVIADEAGEQEDRQQIQKRLSRRSHRRHGFRRTAGLFRQFQRTLRRAGRLIGEFGRVHPNSP